MIKNVIVLRRFKYTFVLYIQKKKVKNCDVYQYTDDSFTIIFDRCFTFHPIEYKCCLQMCLVDRLQFEYTCYTYIYEDTYLYV